MTTEVGKQELCAALKWSRPTLDARIKRDPHFPILQVGGRGGGWKFSLEDVRSYLERGAAPAAVALPVQSKPASRPAPAAEGELDFDAAPAPYYPPQEPVAHRGEATATQRLKNAQAAREEDRLARSRGELVEAAEMQQTLSLVLAELKSTLNDLPGQLGREFGLSERQVHLMRGRIEDAMRSVSRKIRERLTDA